MKTTGVNNFERLAEAQSLSFVDNVKARGTREYQKRENVVYLFIVVYIGMCYISNCTFSLKK